MLTILSTLPKLTDLTYNSMAVTYPGYRDQVLLGYSKLTKLTMLNFPPHQEHGMLILIPFSVLCILFS
jgi:hypothetical protein